MRSRSLVGGRANSASNPASGNETLVAYATGLGPINGPMVTGQPASSTTLEATLQTVTATIGSVPATVSFAGLSPGFTGLYQVNVQLPPNAPTGSSLIITTGGQSSPPISVPVK